MDDRQYHYERQLLRKLLLKRIESARKEQQIAPQGLQEYCAGKETAYLDIFAVLGFDEARKDEENEA